MDNLLPLTDYSFGLTSKAALDRLNTDGFNEFEEKKGFSVWHLVLSQFASPLLYVLVFAAIMKLVLHDWVDAVVIGAVVLVNTLLGFWQEYKAATSLEALKSYLKPLVTVIRDGKKQQIPMRELVIGDVCLLTAGESVPADGMVVSATELVVNESILTGESRSVYKIAGNIADNTDFKMPTAQDKKAESFVFMGTTVASGIGTMVVKAIGTNTEMGKIASTLVNVQETETPLQQRMSALAKTIVLVILISSVFIIGFGLIQKRDLFEMVEMGVALAVAAIPEGLVISMTVILALGMQRILKKKALVRKLVAAETLGSVSVICTDKTGTLTVGKMEVVDFVGDRDELIRACVFANDDRDDETSAMNEWAQIELGKRKVVWSKITNVLELKKSAKRLLGLPFNSQRKFALSVNLHGSTKIASIAGAPEKILEMCTMSRAERLKQKKVIVDLATQGYRLIGFATKRVASEHTIKEDKLSGFGFAGVLVFEDPVRTEVKDALAAAAAAGIGVKVITGDYRETAVAILSKLFDKPIPENMVVTGEELRGLSGKELTDKIRDCVLFARTSPDQKLVIVEELKKMGEVVAMMGDGINDAPALSAADIGVVVNEATDVSKQTADMVLLDSNFETIVEATRQGRMIFQTMRKMVTYLVSTSFQEIMLIGGSLMLNLPLPLSAAQILWINLVQDGMPGLALSFEEGDDGVMQEKPRKRGGSILDLESWSLIGTIGLVTNLVILSVYTYLFNGGYDEAKLPTLIYAIVGTNTLLFIFSIKSLKKNLWNQDIFDNKFLVFSVVLGFLLMWLSLTNEFLMKIFDLRGLRMEDWLIVVLVNFVSVSMVELVKWVFIARRNDHRS